MEGGLGTDGTVNPFADDSSSSISRREYREGMASMKASLKEMMEMFHVQMSDTPRDATTTITPENPKLGVGDITSQSRDGGGGELPPISTNGNGSGAHAAFPPPTSYSHFPLPAPHITHLGPPPVLGRNDYPLWVFRMKSHMKIASEEL